MSKDWATRHLLYFVTTLTGVVSGCVLLSFSPACSCHTFSCEEPPVWSMLCSPIIIQHYKKIWCGVARTQCVPAWEWWAVVKCFAWVWTEINGGATSEQQSLFLWLFNNLSELNPLWENYYFHYCYSPHPLVFIQGTKTGRNMSPVFVQRNVFVCWATLTYESFIQKKKKASI